MPSESIRNRAGAVSRLTSLTKAPQGVPERSFEAPSSLMERARTTLEKHFEVVGGARSGTGFAHGSMSLLAEHTHYFDGFALFFSLPSGTAVAMRASTGEASRLAFGRNDRSWTYGPDHPLPDTAPPPVRIVFETLRRLAPEDARADVAVANAVPFSCADAYIAALGVATAHACRETFLPAGEDRRICEPAHEAVEAGLGHSFSPAFLVAAEQGRPEQYSFVDAATLECMPLEAPPEDALAFGLVETGDRTFFEAGAVARKRKMASEAAIILRRKGFGTMASLRDLEHRDLPVATDSVPLRLRPALRWLVKENQRVPKLVGAIQRKDWQFFGALLLMSDASTRKDWGGTTTDVSDSVVDEVDAMTLDGMYGAFSVNRGRAVVMAGQPFVVPHCLDRVQAGLKRKFDMDVHVSLL